MTLPEICEPLFQYICKLNRLGRAGGSVGPRQVRDEVRGVLADLKSRADREGLGGQFDRIELPLIFFVDHMVRECRLSATWGVQGGWRSLAEERRQTAGDERFWDALEETLLESGDGAGQRLAVFHTMIGLGFTGSYANRPEHLRKKMREIAARVRGLVETDQTGRVTPDAYENVDTRVLTQPPARKLVGLAIVLLGMVAVFAITYRLAWVRGTQQISSTLTRIEESAKGK